MDIIVEIFVSYAGDVMANILDYYDGKMIKLLFV